MAISDKAKELDAALCKVAPGIKILTELSWPETIIERFLESWRRGEPELPNIEYQRAGRYEAMRLELERIAKAADRQDPIGAYIGATADSYATAARMLDVCGTTEFLDLSRELYGDPYDRLPGTRLTHFEAARQLLEVTGPLRQACRDEGYLVCITAEAVKKEIDARTGPFFQEYKPEVVIDANLASKAAASATRIRLRARTSFTESDIDQLIEHEAFVHSATAINGGFQPLKSLALAAPRTTATQEGLATMAELITGAMDLSRLRRLALRIGAVKHAMEGADFVEVFRFFLRAGQNEDESVRSAMRVFRGGDPKGRIAFTKDVVYLHGLIGVHTFLRRAIADGRIELVPRLFAGRLTASDVLKLEPAFDEGDLQPGRFITHWAADPRRLAAHVSFSLILNRIALSNVELGSILERN